MKKFVRAGYANLLTYPPNVKYQERFLKAYQRQRIREEGCRDSPSCGFLPVIVVGTVCINIADFNLQSIDMISWVGVLND